MKKKHKEMIRDFLSNFTTLEEALLSLDNDGKTVYTLEYINNYEGIRDGTQYEYFTTLEEVFSELGGYTRETKDLKEFIKNTFERDLDDDFDDVKYSDVYFERYEDMEDFMKAFENFSEEEKEEAFVKMEKFMPLDSIIDELASKRDYYSYEVY